MTGFHFMRPEILWLLIPVAFLFYKLNQSAKNRSGWGQVISPHLLKFLFTSAEKKRPRTNFWITASISLLTIFAISGPSLREKSVPVFQTENAQVVLLDLSLSMDATDIKPSRIERAKYKLLDLLKKTQEGTVALIVYAGEAFVISPLTSDANTIVNMVPSLSTRIMPVLGSRPDIAIKKSIELLRNAKKNRGQIIWLTDGIDEQYIQPIARAINNSNYQLSILAIGTEQGAPIPLPGTNGFLKDSQGTIVLPKLQTKQLRQVAKNTNAGLTQLSADDTDINYLSQYLQWQIEKNTENSQTEQSLSRSVDDGYWLIWLVIFLLIIKLFKEPSTGLLNTIITSFGLLIISGFSSPNVSALDWKGLWLTKDQQAKQAFNSGNFEQAAKLYENNNWRATAQYKKGDFAAAAKNFSDNHQSDLALYNKATSLAKANELEKSLAAYNALLERSPHHEDAKFNKQLIENLLKQQQQNNQQESEEAQKGDNQKESDSNNETSKTGDKDSNKEKQQQQKTQQQTQKENQQEDAEQKKKEAAQKHKEQGKKNQQQKQSPKQAEITEDQRKQSEKDQALEHWLKKIPDDPGGLLRRKMYREYQRRGRQQKEEKLW